MDKIPLEVLKKSRLFKNITEENIAGMLKCISQGVKTYDKNEFIVRQHGPVEDFGVILSGSCQIVKDDYEGNRTIVNTIGAGDFFGEAIVFSSFKNSPVSILVKKKTDILWLSKNCVVNPCKNAHSFHNIFILNIIEIISNRNYALNKKLDVVSQRTIRDKLLTYFYNEVESSGKLTIVMPYTKSELAEFICVERTAMYRVLKQLEEEGVLTVDGNVVTILQERD